MKVSLDFETRSRADLKKEGAWQYSMHPSTEILCTAWAIDDGPVFCERGMPDDLLMLADEPNVTFHAYNAGFEYAIWKNVATMVPKHAVVAII